MIKQSRNHSPIKESLLPRPRIDQLLEQGLKKSLVTVVAGTGYGKTQVVAASLKKTKGKLVWLTLSKMDEVTSRFWQSFIYVLHKELPKIAVALSELLFPETTSGFDAFLRIFAKGIYSEEEQVILVLDDYSQAKSKGVHNFFSRLVEANLENLCLVVISREKTELKQACTAGGGKYSEITSEDLKFTFAETKELFRLNQLSVSDTVLKQINQQVDGWPLVLFVLTAQGHANIQLNSDYPFSADATLLDGLFEKEYFSQYPQNYKSLLIKLSYLPNFPAEIVLELCPKNALEILEQIQINMFVSFETSRGLYTFHRMYHGFLSQKQFMVQDQEIPVLFNLVGDYYFRNQKYLEAIEFYGKCQNYDQMLKAMYQIPIEGISLELANFLHEYLDLLPATYLHNNPMAEYFTAILYLNNLEIDRAEAILSKLETRLESTGSPEFREVLGEVYLSLAAVCLIRNQDGFSTYYQKSCQCLSAGSSLKSSKMLYVGNNSVFFLMSSQAGQCAYMEQLWFETLPYMEKVLKGGARGFDFLFSAEAAYYTIDLVKAKKQAFKAIEQALKLEQHDIVINGHFVLARVHLAQGDFKGLQNTIDYIQTYINDQNLINLFEIRDTIESWFHVRIGDAGKILPWMRLDQPQKRDQAPINLGRDKLVYADYLIQKEEYYELLALLNSLGSMYQKRGLWIAQLYVLIMRAIGYFRINEVDGALNAFWQAYQMSYQNEILAPFMEAGKHMRVLVNAARQQGRYEFDSVWLDKVYQKSSTYAKKLSAAAKAYNKKNLKRTVLPAVNLSKRELEVLLGLSQGLTRDEIADFYSVSVNTIKSTIKNIYAKLGAVNRADAVRIAISLGLIA